MKCFFSQYAPAEVIDLLTGRKTAMIILRLIIERTDPNGTRISHRMTHTLSLTDPKGLRESRRNKYDVRNDTLWKKRI